MSISPDLSKFEDIINRLKEAIGEKTDTALAERLGLTRQNIYAARQKDEVPPGWIFKISEETGYSLDWIKYGEEPKKLKRYAEKEDQKKHLTIKAENAAYSRNGGYEPSEIGVSIEIKKVIDILESKTSYSIALRATINAFYHALKLEKNQENLLDRIKDLENRIMDIEDKKNKMI